VSAVLKSNFDVEKKYIYIFIYGNEPPIFLLLSNNACESFLEQNSCLLQLDKSPNLLLSGKEPARAGRLSAAVFQYLLYCLFFLNAPKWIPHHFLS
jgi:hypothetical protein